jgi:hypothetical protein
MAFFHGDPAKGTSNDAIVNKIRETIRRYPADDYDSALKDDVEWPVFFICLRCERRY